MCILIYKLIEIHKLAERLDKFNSPTSVGNYSATAVLDAPLITANIALILVPSPIVRNKAVQL